MADFIKIKRNEKPNFTLVPNSFIREQMVSMSDSYIKIYLYLLYVSGNDLDMTIKDIAYELMVNESIIERAIGHFEDLGLLVCQSLSGQKNFENTSTDHGEVSSLLRSSPSPVDESLDEANQSMTGSDDLLVNKLDTISDIPSYGPDDLAAFKENDEAAQLLFFTESLLARQLDVNELKILYSLHDWLGLPYDVIEFLIENSVNNGKKSIRYFEKVAMDWAKNKLMTLEDAKKYARLYPSVYYDVLKAFGISNRDPNPKEIEFMNKWMNDFNFDISLIVEACNRTILNINRPSFAYADSILTDWHKKGLNTLDKVSQNDKDYKKMNTKSNPSTSYKPKSNSFNSYKQRDDDFSAMGKAAHKQILKEYAHILEDKDKNK